MGQPCQVQPDPFPLPQFFSDVREAEEQLRKLQETMRRKYTCDRSITVTRLEDLLQDAQVSQLSRVPARRRAGSRRAQGWRGTAGAGRGREVWERRLAAGPQWWCSGKAPLGAEVGQRGGQQGWGLGLGEARCGLAACTAGWGAGN